MVLAERHVVVGQDLPFALIRLEQHRGAGLRRERSEVQMACPVLEKARGCQGVSERRARSDQQL